MITTVREFLISNGYPPETSLSALPDSCCQHCNALVFPFDQAKDQFFANIGITHRLKSVDLLFIPKERHELYLIEMKRKPSTVECKDFVRQHLEEGTLRSKVIDSLIVLFGILGVHNINAKEPAFYSYFFNPSKLKIKACFLSNFTAEEMVVINLANLGKSGLKITRQFDPDLAILNCDMFFRNFA